MRANVEANLLVMEPGAAEAAAPRGKSTDGDVDTSLRRLKRVGRFVLACLDVGLDFHLVHLLS